MTGSSTAQSRPREGRFFTEYWRSGRPRWRVYRYQWFLRPCRDFVFQGLARAPQGMVLELGGGGGSVARNETSITDVALDILPPASRRNRSVVGDAQSLPFKDESFTGIWEQTMLMHVSPCLAASEAHRVLKPGGIFAIVEPLNGHPAVTAIRRLLPGRASSPRFMSLDDVRSMGSGFSRGEVRPFFLISPLLLMAGRMTRRVERLQALDARILGRLPRLHGRAWYAAAWFRK